MTQQELPVTEFADFASWFLPIDIHLGSWKHPFFVETVFTIAISAKLAEVHLIIVLEDEITAADAGVCLRFIPTGCTD